MKKFFLRSTYWTIAIAIFCLFQQQLQAMLQEKSYTNTCINNKEKLLIIPGSSIEFTRCTIQSHINFEQKRNINEKIVLKECDLYASLTNFDRILIFGNDTLKTFTKIAPEVELEATKKILLANVALNERLYLSLKNNPLEFDDGEAFHIDLINLFFTNHKKPTDIEIHINSERKTFITFKNTLINCNVIIKSRGPVVINLENSMIEHCAIFRTDPTNTFVNINERTAFFKSKLPFFFVGNGESGNTTINIDPDCPINKNQIVHERCNIISMKNPYRTTPNKRFRDNE